MSIIVKRIWLYFRQRPLASIYSIAEMSSLKVRLLTFRDRQIPEGLHTCTSTELAYFGFMFNKATNTISCYECDLELTEFDNPATISSYHKEQSPECNFANQEEK